MFLKQNDIALLNKIRYALEGSPTLPNLLSLCREISGEIAPTLFPYTYAGVLLASRGKIKESMETLAHAKEKPFSMALGSFLSETRDFSPPTTTFGATGPYDVWVQTAFYKTYLSETLKVIVDFATRNPPVKDDEGMVTILDLGIGNGVFTTEIVTRIHKIHDIDKIRIIAVDPSQAMLQKAEIYCCDKIPISVTIVPWCAKAQGLTGCKTPGMNYPVWFVNAAASIHHMPAYQKAHLLTNLAPLGCPVLITEFHGNHDKTEQDSPEFVYSVTEFYSYFIQDILSSPVSPGEKMDCVNNLALSEAITMLKNTWENRVDYHATIDEWKEIATRAKYRVKQLRNVASLPDRPLVFFMELEYRKESA